MYITCIAFFHASKPIYWMVDGRYIFLHIYNILLEFNNWHNLLFVVL